MKENNFNLNDCVCFLTSRASKGLSEVLEKRVSEYGVTRVQWIAMYYINQDEMLSQKELADRLGIKEPTVVRLIDRCEKDNLVKRIPLKSDARKKGLILTDKGQELNKTITVLAEKFMYDAIEGISMDDLNTYTRVISKMLDNFDIPSDDCSCR